MSERRRRPSRGRVSRDTVLLAAGLAGIAYQQAIERVLWPLLLMYGAMVGLRGSQALLRILAARVDREQLEGPGTSGPSSRSRSRSSRR
ncbi:hypothetical protein ABT297_04010 [Dactylosporangium sp. NPDC000555]|uniref:hypothetical protein n=1 Tax=Dactylosporangium sp. NPDC000555 TaxID=3154260 RepID=UPI00331A0F3E